MQKFEFKLWFLFFLIIRRQLWINHDGSHVGIKDDFAPLLANLCYAIAVHACALLSYTGRKSFLQVEKDCKKRQKMFANRNSWFLLLKCKECQKFIRMYASCKKTLRILLHSNDEYQLWRLTDIFCYFFNFLQILLYSCKLFSFSVCYQSAMIWLAKHFF